MDTLLLSRIQFAVTIGFHFLFPPISIGLAWLLVWIEWRGRREEEGEGYRRLARLFGSLLGLTFVMGVSLYPRLAPVGGGVGEEPDDL